MTGEPEGVNVGDIIGTVGTGARVGLFVKIGFTPEHTEKLL